MPGIVTVSTAGGSNKSYRAVFTSSTTSLAINFVTGTTATSTGNNAYADKGVAVVFQNQSTAADVTVGGSWVTVNAAGIVIAAKSATNPGTLSLSVPVGSTSIQMADWWVTSTSSLAVCEAMLMKHV